MSRRTGGGLGRGGHTSDPLAVHIVPSLPRKSGCPTPATQKRRSPRDTRGTPGRTSDPLAVHIVPRSPRKSSGAQGTPEGRQDVHPTPWQCTLSHACHAKAAEPKGHQRDARAYIASQCTLSHACHAKAAEVKGHQRDASTSDPLPVHIVPRLPRKSSGAQGTPEGRQGVHPTPCQCTLSHACHAKAAEPKKHQRDARAYIRPLGSAHCPTPATQKQLKGHQRDARAYIRPLASAHCPTPATQKRRSPKDTRGTPGRTSDPLPALSHACCAKAAEPKGHQRDARAYIRPLGSAHCPTPAAACHAKAAEPKGHQRDATAYIRPLGNAHCPTPATQKQRSPRDTRGTPGRTSDPLAVHIVPRL